MIRHDPTLITLLGTHPRMKEHLEQDVRRKNVMEITTNVLMTLNNHGKSNIT